MTATRTMWARCAPVLVGAAIALGSAATHAPAWAAGAPLAEATEEQKAQAQREYLQAKKAFDGKRYEEALEGFQASYDIVASPNSHHMVVRSLDALGRHVEAYQEAQATLEEAEQAAATDDKYKKTVAAARGKLNELRSKVGLVTINVTGASDEATLTVGDQEIDRSQWGKPMPIAPGKITIQLEDDDLGATRELTVVAGGSAQVALQPAEEEPDDHGGGTEPAGGEGSSALRIASYVAGGVGVAGFILFAVGGGLHLSQWSELRDRCEAGICPQGTQADIDRGRTYQTLANVGIGVGAGGLGLGVILFIASQADVQFEAKDSSSKTHLAIGPGSVTLRGTF